MNKYIDAEKLKTTLETRIAAGLDGYGGNLKWLLEILDSLQQEQQEIDMDADIEMEWDSFNKHLAEYGEESEDVVWLNWNSFGEIARYFYELGINAKKNEE